MRPRSVSSSLWTRKYLDRVGADFKAERGWASDLGTALFGASTSHRREDEAHAEAHRAKQEHRQNQLIAEEKARREAERKKAEDRLNKAREREAQLHEEIEKAVKDLSLNENRLVNAKANLAKASADLKRLGNQELELVSIYLLGPDRQDADVEVGPNRRDPPGIHEPTRQTQEAARASGFVLFHTGE